MGVLNSGNLSSSRCEFRGCELGHSYITLPQLEGVFVVVSCYISLGSDITVAKLVETFEVGFFIKRAFRSGTVCPLRQASISKLTGRVETYRVRC